jgi:hypothetical protein
VLQLSDPSIDAPRGVLLFAGREVHGAEQVQLKRHCEKSFRIVTHELQASWRQHPCEDYKLDNKERVLLERFHETIFKNGLSNYATKTSPRHLRLDTLLLPALVAGLTDPGKAVSLDEFLSRMVGLGLVVGPDHGLPHRWELLARSEEELDRLLTLNKRLFKGRLILAGYARTYSDGQTEVSDGR